MKTTSVIVPWPQGLHLRAASQIVKVARSFRSQVQLQFDSTLADATSVLSLLLLEAGLGSQLVLHVTGEDEHEVVQALQVVFASTQQATGDHECASDSTEMLLEPQTA